MGVKGMVQSSLLSTEENELLRSLLEKKLNSLAVGVAQLYTTNDQDKHSKWHHHTTGVLCFLNNSKDCYTLFQLFSLPRKSKVWEQKVYSGFSLRLSSRNFLTFEGDSCMIGLNFANVKEASSVVSAYNASTKSNTATKRKLTMSDDRKTRSTFSDGSSVEKTSSLTVKKKKSETKKKGTKMTVEISGPADFQHVNHVGYNPASGFDLEECEGAWKKLFKTLGISKKMLSNTEASNFIYDFVSQNGGIDNLVKEIDVLEQEQKPIPKVRSRESKRQKDHVIAGGEGIKPPSMAPPALPPMTSAGLAQDAAAPNIPKRGSANACHKPSFDATVGGTAATATPPPPPPPPPSLTTASVPTPRTSEQAPNIAARKNVPPQQTDSRSGLLEQIAKGKALKQVTQTSRPDKPSDAPSDSGGMVGVLASRLAVMRLNVADDGSDNEKDQTSDWDD